MRLMLIDDHEIVRAGYRRFLATRPALEIAFESGNAEDAYRLLQAAEAEGRLPDLALVDISLGERSGIDLIERGVRRFPSLRWLVFSMHESPTVVEHALGAGACGYVSKSSPPDTVITAIESIRRNERFVDPALRDKLSRHREDAARLAQLTRRELEILSQFIRGASSDSVAESLCVSTKTVANHLSSIRQKLNVANDFQLVRLVESIGLPIL